MAQHRPRIVVIGAGIIGSAITYNLAIRGADVLLIDKGPMPGSGVTGRAFGWVNVVNGTPGDNSYVLWCEAIADVALPLIPRFFALRVDARAFLPLNTRRQSASLDSI